jgi:hypothetical protein
VLASKRGLGRDELRYATGEFLEAIRWVAFVEKLAPDLVQARVTAATDPGPDSLKGGPALIEFNARRLRARDRVAELEPILYPPDPEPDGA